MSCGCGLTICEHSLAWLAAQSPLLPEPAGAWPTLPETLTDARRVIDDLRAEVARLTDQVAARGQFSDVILAKATRYAELLDQQRRAAHDAIDLASRAVEALRASEERRETAEAAETAAQLEVGRLGERLARAELRAAVATTSLAESKS